MKNTLVDEVISLPVDQRAELIDILIKSLNPAVDNKIEKLWAKEAEHRAEEIRKKNVKTIPDDEVIAGIRKRFKK